jgi:ribosome-binding protein aMBF1 (putative translation factor)
VLPGLECEYLQSRLYNRRDDRLRPVSAEHRFELPHQCRPLFELWRVMRPPRSASTAEVAEVEAQKSEAFTSLKVAHAASEEEFALVSALIGARAEAGLSQSELAARMGTSQAAIARLESGRYWPTTRTLQRLAEATGTRLRISFQPRDAT